MAELFVLSRTWGYYDAHGFPRTQAMDGDYINGLSAVFRRTTMAMVIANPAEFDFVSNYRSRLVSSIQVVPLRQTLRGSLLGKLHNQWGNLVVIMREVRSASHVVVFMSSLSAVWAALCARAFGKRLLVYSGNDWAVDTALRFRDAPGWLRGLASLVTDWLETLVLRLAEVRLVNSPQLFDKCRGLGGISERVRPVSRFHLTDAFSREDTCQGQIARIVYPAAIIPRKNHATLLRAIALLRGRGIEAELLLAGAFESEQIRTELFELVNSLGIADHIKFLGYVAGTDEMLSLLRGADVFVLPSLNEGFPRVIWEAMLQSLPCAVSRIPNIVADIGHRDVALMFDPLDAEDIATALQRIICDADLRRRLIRNGHAYACDVFAESCYQQIARVLREWI